ncbi:hypothetical protein CWT12_06445 [Actinomyces sp. 432]|uniref:hypothetical protein n=1 Tax=Actinomyces sp. 432 TaxID=2057798 RepID=UPI0013742B1A|nr:hypothetical protein [Actinomyces sp. 432]QHO91027.1 hypothetical protein CWT12_06445 [Actinomyces sp. 432]
MTATPRAVDAKEILLTWLTDQVSVPVVSTRPDNKDAPATFVRLLLTGGTGRHDRALHTTQLTIDSYAPTTAAAVELALAVDAAVHGAVAGLSPVVRVSGTSPSESPDPDTTSARATATYQITTRLLT